MKQFRNDCQLIIVDALLYLEAGKWLTKLVQAPMLNRYTFDHLVKGYSKGKCVLSHNAAGPFQVTNPFVHDYLEKGNNDDSVVLLQSLVEVNTRFSNIPIYQIQSVIGFITKIGNQTWTGKSIHKLPEDSFLVGSIMSDKTFTRFFTPLYKRYYGAMTSDIELRIARYVKTYLKKGKMFIHTFSDDEVWDD